MQEFFINLIIGIVGGIFSSIIVSRIFLIRGEYYDQLEVLRKTSYHLGSIVAFFDVIEIVLKVRNDTTIELQRNPDYALNSDLIEAEPLIQTLKNEILYKNIDNICINDTNFALKEKNLIELQIKASRTVEKFKSLDLCKFETVDKCKKDISQVKKELDKCFAERTKSFFLFYFRRSPHPYTGVYIFL